jgi:catechol 2,3-dioxygenase-like lactoylglutathione lyase family enzyme
MRIAKLALVVRDYDEAIAWFTRCLGFELAEWHPHGNKEDRTIHMVFLRQTTSIATTRMVREGVHFRERRSEPYGKVVFEDISGNAWDLIGPA